MTTPSSQHHHQRADELLEDYLLGTLSADDAAWMREHIAACSICQAELRDLAPAASALPFAAPAPPVAPSPDLWHRIERSIARPGPDAPSSAPAPITRLTARHWIGLAALMLLSLLGGIILGQVLPWFDEQDEARTIAIQITDPSIQATGELQYLPEEQVFVLHVEGMPDPPPGHVYQAWLIGDGNPIPVGVMNPELENFASAGDPQEFQTFAITIEPGPLGNATPTSEPILVASLD